MAKLAAPITMAVVDEYGPDEMLRRLADPWWFQAFGCVLGFDWHSSGVTTVTCGALKEAYKLVGADLGIVVAGGKGATSRKAPTEIATACDRFGVSQGEKLVYASRMSAKVDSAAVQDGYDVYHHSFFFSRAGGWCVVQQGMSEASGYARRYHWLGESVDDFVCEPHAGIRDAKEKRVNRAQPELPVLNMVANEAGPSREASAALVRENPDKVMSLIDSQIEGPTLFAPSHHPVLPSDVNLERLRKVIQAAHERYPQDFETLLGTPNVGPATVRSLALIAELIYDAPACHRDPAQAPERKWADYSYAHGGKDGHPFPVNREAYDQSIHVLTEAVSKSRLGVNDKTDALRRLARYGV
jgi:hypothetical protein